MFSGFVFGTEGVCGSGQSSQWTRPAGTTHRSTAAGKRTAVWRQCQQERHQGPNQPPGAWRIGPCTHGNQGSPRRVVPSRFARRVSDFSVRVSDCIAADILRDCQCYRQTNNVTGHVGRLPASPSARYCQGAKCPTLNLRLGADMKFAVSIEERGRFPTKGSEQVEQISRSLTELAM